MSPSICIPTVARGPYCSWCPYCCWRPYCCWLSDYSFRTLLLLLAALLPLCCRPAVPSVCAVSGVLILAGPVAGVRFLASLRLLASLQLLASVLLLKSSEAGKKKFSVISLGGREDMVSVDCLKSHLCGLVVLAHLQQEVVLHVVK